MTLFTAKRIISPKSPSIMNFVTFSRLPCTPPAQTANPTSTVSPIKNMSSTGLETICPKISATLPGDASTKEPLRNFQK